MVPWCVGGDINAVRFPEERLGASRLSRHMRNFNGFIQELGLVDLPLRGASFTWKNNQSRRMSSRLDQFLFTDDWLELAPTFIQEALPSSLSDHTLIILRPIVEPTGP